MGLKKLGLKFAISLFLVAFTVNIFGQSNSFYVQTKNNGLLVNLTSGIQQNLPITGNYTLKKAFDLTGFGLENVIKLDFTKAVENDSQVITALMKTGYFNYVEEVPIYFTSFVPNDYQSQQWYLKKINAFNAYDRIGNTSNIVIAIVDDGLDTAHPDIHPNLWHNIKEIPGNGIDDDLNGFVDDYVGWNVANNTNNPNATNASQSHGTHCAGIASAATNNALGIASMGYGAKIMIVKCGDISMPKKILNSIDGVAYAIKNNADIISMSYGGGGPQSVTEQALFDKADRMGIICIAASGNGIFLTPNTLFYPAAYNHVIAVAASDSNDRKASFSNYGSFIDITAPGLDIYSTLPFNRYGYESGTSMACPLVAGLCAAMKSRNPNASKQTIENCLLSTAKNIDSLNPGFKGFLGSGRIDAEAAMLCIKKVNAEFSSNFNAICAGTSVNFKDLTTGSPSIFKWTFQGGTPSSSFSQNPTVTFNTNGIYSVGLIACDLFECDTIAKVGFIEVAPPYARIVANKNVYKGDMSYFSVTLKGTPPFQFTYTNGKDTFTRKNVFNTPFQETYLPDSSKTLDKVWLISMKDSLCTGNVYDTGRYKIIPYRTCTYSVKSHHKIASNTTGFTGALGNTNAFGFQTASLGDIDANGIEDFAISAPYKTIGGYSYAGSIFTLLMDSQGKVKSYKEITHGQNGFSGNLRTNYYLGFGMSTIGDFDKDGVSDLVFGGLGQDGGTNKGEIWLAMMNSNGTIKSNHKISLNIGNFNGPLLGTSNFGNEIDTLGDIDHNGYMDLLVTAYQDDAGGTQRGASFILYLDSNKTVKKHTKISSLTTGFTGLLDNNDQFGFGTGMGYLDDDTVVDLAIGVLYDDDAGTDVGAFYVLFMNANGTVKSYTKVTKNVNGGPSDLNSSDIFGYEVKNIGDWDKDGVVDLAVSALLKDDGGTDKGAFYLCFMNKDGSIREYQKISATAGSFTGTLNTSNHFGTSLLRIKDYNNDGEPDLLIGSRFDDEGGSQRGAAWILNMQKICVKDPDFSKCRLKADFNINPVCYSENQFFNSTSIDSNAQNVAYFKWYLGNGDSVIGKSSFSYKYKNPGNYQVKLIAGSDGRRACFDTTIKTINIPDSFKIKLLKVPTICYGDSVTLGIEQIICEKGNILVDWYPSKYFNGKYIFHDPKIGTLESTKIWAVARNIAGKISSDTIFIKVDSTCCKTWPVAQSDKQIYCMNDTLKIKNLTKPFGPATYEWTFGPNMSITTYKGVTPPFIFFTKGGATFFNLKVSDICGSFEETFYIGVSSPPYADMADDTLVGCIGDTVMAGKYNLSDLNYSWFPANKIIENNDGLVKIKVESSPFWMYRTATNPNSGCTAIDSVLIKKSNITGDFFKFTDTTICNTDSLVLNPNVSGNSYLWSDGKTTSYNTIKSKGLFWLEVSTSCTLSDSFYLHFDSITTNSIIGDSVICNSNAVWLKPNPTQINNSYLWNNSINADSLMVAMSGNISLTIKNGKCTKNLNKNVQSYLPKNSLQILGDSQYCNKDSVLLESNLSGNIIWNTGETTQKITPKTPGKYWLSIKENICIQYDSIDIKIDDVPYFTLGNDTVICNDSTFTIYPSPVLDPNIYTYLWNDGSSNTQLLAKLNQEYWLAINKNNCKRADSIQIQFGKTPVVQLMEDTIICSNDSIVLSNLKAFGNLKYLWNDAGKNASKTVSVDGIYWLKASNECGTSTDTFELQTKNCLCKVHVPNVFTPNNDGLNDLFKPVLDGCLEKDYLFTIYNRWGQKVFENNNPAVGWNGKDVQNGAYYWILRLKSPYIENGKEFYLNGQVLIN